MKKQNSGDLKTQPQINNAPIERIEEDLNIIAEALKNGTAGERDYKLQKTAILCSFLGAIIGGLLTIFGVVVSNQANILMKKNTEPFFQLNAIEEDGKKIAYQITNTGGQIQSATIVLRNYINVHVLDDTRDQYYFPCTEITRTFAAQNENCFLIDCTETFFGVDQWTRENGITSLLRDRLDEAGIIADISYLETMEIQYIDASRNVVDELYAIKEDEISKLQLYLITSEYIEMISSLIPKGSDFKFREVDSFSRTLSTARRTVGGNGLDPAKVYCYSIVNKLKEEIDQKANLTFD